MCFGGGGNASAEAQAAEDRRRAQVKQAQDRIEAIFGGPGREADIQDFIGDTRDLLTGDLGRANDINQRKLKFALARSGLSGGSASVDLNKDLAEAFLRGNVEAERRAQGAGSNLRAQDQQSKLGLFSQATAGLDTTTAARNAALALKNNITAAGSDSLNRNFDRFFTNFAEIFKGSKERSGERQARLFDFGTIFGQTSNPGARVSGGADFSFLNSGGQV